MKRLELNYLLLLKRILPMLFAAWAVSHESDITLWIERRESALLVGVFLLLSALLHPRLQRGLIVTLSYGVAFLALREAFRVFQYPAPLAASPVAYTRSLLLLTSAVFAITGAIHESLQKRSIVGRRFYTGAGAIYFLDHGITALLWAHSWQSLVFVFSGITCAIGAIFAEKFALMGTIETEARTAVAAETLIEKTVCRTEWHDTTEELTIPPGQ